MLYESLKHGVYVMHALYMAYEQAIDEALQRLKIS